MGVLSSFVELLNNFEDWEEIIQQELKVNKVNSWTMDNVYFQYYSAFMLLTFINWKI